jgi:hypothetical protein
MRGLGAIDLLEAGSERGALTSAVNVAGPFATRAQDRAGDMKTPGGDSPADIGRLRRVRTSAMRAHGLRPGGASTPDAVVPRRGARLALRPISR